jgi:hypothetical protein
MPPPTTAIAVDWSGAADPRRTLWLAEHTDDGVVQLRDGFSHREIADTLISRVTQHVAAGRSLVIGLDFAFGYPAAFAARHGLDAIEQLWALAELEGARWLRCEVPPFWGRAGCRADRAIGWGGPRVTDAEITSRGLGRPKSPYQVTGGGAVGSSTIRGMPVLRALREHGAAIWPFDAPGLVTVLELYPRVATGAVIKRDASARATWLAAHPAQSSLSPELVARAAGREDAFDALAAVLWLWAYRHDVARSGRTGDAARRLEGAIWVPTSLGATPVAE